MCRSHGKIASHNLKSELRTIQRRDRRTWTSITHGPGVMQYRRAHKQMPVLPISARDHSAAECDSLRSMGQLSMENLSSECRTLKVLLQVGIHAQFKRLASELTDGPANSPSSTLSASMLDGAHDLRIDGGDIANVVGSSNFIIFIRQELGIGFRRSVLVLLSLLVACMFFRLL
ncbi:hypothetical protein F5887DRAFT_994684 [Amanita rubescens]|nr:hypothetical protein F5887DRAFT_994684 [Amanita rubescens]